MPIRMLHTVRRTATGRIAAQSGARHWLQGPQGESRDRGVVDSGPLLPEVLRLITRILPGSCLDAEAGSG